MLILKGNIKFLLSRSFDDTYSGVETNEDCGHAPARCLRLKHLELELADLSLEVLAAAPDEAALGPLQPADAAISEAVPYHNPGQGGGGPGAEDVILILEVELGLRCLIVIVSGAG